jgi:tRNA(Leu) C34 or U34 (ribose-2'-O)-methylase TrmL
MEKLTEKEQAILDYLEKQNLVSLKDVQNEFVKHSKQEVIYLLEQMREKKYVQFAGEEIYEKTGISLTKEAREFLFGGKND